MVRERSSFEVRVLLTEVPQTTQVSSQLDEASRSRVTPVGHRWEQNYPQVRGKGRHVRLTPSRGPPSS